MKLLGRFADNASRFRLLPTALVLAVISGVAYCAPLEPEPHFAEIARRFSNHLPSQHLMRYAVDDELSARAWTNFLSEVDYERAYFTQADLEEFAEYRYTLDDALVAGDLTFPYKVYERYLEHVRNRYEYVCALLEKEFDLSVIESYRWRRRDAEWCKDDAARDDLWRKKVKNEYVRRVINEELAASETPAQDEAEEAAGDGEEDASISHEEFIRKRYEQYLIVMEDGGPDRVLQLFLSAFAHAYDPHSDYMLPTTLEEFNIDMKLSLTGIGAELRPEDGTARVVRLVAGGPADRDTRDVRLLPGDKIIAVGQDDGPIQDVLHWPLTKTVRLIRGKKGTRVVMRVIAVSDPTGGTIKTVDLIRDAVKLEDQAAKSKTYTVPGTDGIARTCGVVELPAFYANMEARSVISPDYRSSAHDVRKQLLALKKQGVDGIILDLRNNGGGSLLEAIRMTGLFIEEGPTVQVRERFGVRPLDDKDPSIIYDGPLVVLVNRLSASASEIVAAALQDYGRAVVVGDSKTHGKGTVQAIQKLGRDDKLGVVKITSSIFYRISGGSTQLRGVAPDIVVPSVLDYMELGEDQLPNAIPWSVVRKATYRADSTVSALLPLLEEESEARRSTNQLFQAHERLLQRVDLFSKTDQVPLDIERRRRQAAAERELFELRESLAGGAEDDEAADLTKDLVLSEALHILADLAELLQQAEDSRLAADTGVAIPEPPRSLLDVIGDWFRNGPGR